MNSHEVRHFRTMFSFSLWTVLALLLVLATVAVAVGVNAWVNTRRGRRR